MADRKLSAISLGVVILLVQLWMLVNTDVLFTENARQWKDVILVYLILQVTVFAIPDLRSKLLDTPALKGFLKVLVFAVITIALLSMSLTFLRSSSLAGLSRGVMSLIILHGFIVAVIEENIFRHWLGKVRRWGNIRQAGIFAIFHYSVYSGNLFSLAFIFLLGLALFWVKMKWSPKTDLANIGVHWGYNVFVLGLLPLLNIVVLNNILI